MLVIGLTGGIGSGKTTVANLFAKRGIHIIDADIITRELTQPNQPALKAIIEHIGPHMLHPDGTLNRRALRKLIFDHPQEKQWLENLLHPLVRREMKQQADNAHSPYCIAVIPLLLETEKNPLIHRILIIDTEEQTQLHRTHSRDQTTHDEIKRIIDSQIKRSERLALADDIIDNHGDLSELEPQVEKLHQFYLTLARSNPSRDQGSAKI